MPLAFGWVWVCVLALIGLLAVAHSMPRHAVHSAATFCAAVWLAVGAAAVLFHL